MRGADYTSQVPVRGQQESPIWSAVKKEPLFGTIPAYLSPPPALRCPALLPSGPARVFQLQAETQPEGKRDAHPMGQRGDGSHRQNRALERSALMQTGTPNTCGLTGPRNNVLIGQNGAALIGGRGCY